jgi:hypothetical protein
MSELKVMSNLLPKHSSRPPWKLLVLAVFAFIGLACSGCPALMIPGLAYSGYQYEKKGTPEAQSTQPDSQKKSSSSQQGTIPDSEIE